MPAIQNIRISPSLTRSLAVTFFACLFFLCSADQFFTTHLWGLNFRWGQLLLLAAGLLALVQSARRPVKGTIVEKLHIKLLAYWVPFFAVYALAALLSPAPKPTLLKWGWAAFNIGLSAMVCLNPRWSEPLKRGFAYAVFFIAGLIWLEALAIYWFGAVPQTDTASTTLQVHLGPLFTGYVQPSWVYLGTQFFRPNAFYYEPSYAGAALAFVFPLFLCPSNGRRVFPDFAWAALVLGAILLCSSRSGIFSAFFALLIIFVLAPFFQAAALLKRIFKVFGLTLVFLAVFSVPSHGFNYLRFIGGPLGTAILQHIQHATENPKKVMDDINQEAARHQQIQMPTTSEGERLSNIGDDIQVWSHHLFWGNGITPPPGAKSSGLSQIAMNTWLEIGVESGILGLMAFLFALLATMGKTLENADRGPVRICVLGAWTTHFLVALNFTQTFPRLDYWLIFFLSISMLVNRSASPKPGPFMEGRGR